MNALHTLGFPTKVPYAPGLALAPVPVHPSLRRPAAAPRIVRNHTPPTERQDPALRQRAGAVLGGLAAALVQLDHFARQAQALGAMNHGTKQALGQLATLTDKFLALAQDKFESQDADAANALSEVLGQSAELLLQLTPEQIESSLKHMHNMALSNVNYVPVPVSPAYREPLEELKAKYAKS